MAQTSVLDSQVIGLEGQLYDLGPKDVVTRKAGESIPFGRGMAQTATENEVKAPASTGFIFEGVAVHDHAREDDGSGTRQYVLEDAVSIMRTGRIWVLTEEAVADDDDVFLRHTAGGAGEVPGRWRTDLDTNKADQIVNARWIKGNSGANELALLEIFHP